MKRDNILHRTYIQLRNYKSTVIHTFHLRSSLHFTSLHITSLLFTTLHSPMFTSMHFSTFRNHASKPLVVKHEGKRQRERPRFRCEYGINIYLKE